MKVIQLDPSCFTLPYDHCLSEALVRKGCEVTFISSHYLYDDWIYQSNYQRFDHFYRITNSIYGHIPTGFLRKQIKGVEHVVDMYELVSNLSSIKPTIIHFQWIPFPLIDSLFVKRLRKLAPIILTVHDVYPYHSVPSSKFQLMYFHQALKLFDHLIVHTRSSYTVLTEDFKISTANISIIPHGIFDYYVQSSLPKEPTHKKKRTILFFGTIKPYKGVDVLIQAYAKLPQNIIERTTLLIAGNPKMDISPLKSLAEHLGIEQHIDWRVNYAPEEKVGEILQEATVFVLPYKHFEAQSGALMALLPFGRPIVTTDISCFKEILTDRKHGFLVPPDDPTALAKALADILTDCSRIKSMGNAVKKLANDHFSWNSIATKTIDLYNKLL